MLFVLTLFGCVVLHELGHALAARAFGIVTHGITLLPVGGVAQLDRIPREPAQECLVALAGPAVNVLIAALLLPLVSIGSTVGDGPTLLGFGHSFLERLMWVNLVLAGFNLLPAFPMDGGRILRATLAIHTDYVTATRWAKRLGQGAALVLALLGLWVNPMLVLIAAFVAFAGETEYRHVRQESRWPTPWVHRPEAATHTARPALMLQPAWVGSTVGNSAASNYRLSQSHDHQLVGRGIVVIRRFPAGDSMLSTSDEIG
jgi:Zn-dependent protease